MSTSTVIMIRTSDLRPGDFLDLEGDIYCDPPDHCLTCDKPIQWFPEDEWTHTEDPEADANHDVIAIPRNISLEFEGVEVHEAYTPGTFNRDRQVHLMADFMRPGRDEVLIVSTMDEAFTLPHDHEVKVIERRCPVCHEAEHPEGADLEAESRMLASMGLDPNTGGDAPSYGELVDAQGRVDALVAEYGCIVKVIDSLA